MPAGANRLDAARATVLGMAPFRLSGTLYGVLLNHHAGLAALGEAVHRPPYQAPPKGVVLYLKPRNTLLASGDAVEVDDPDQALEVGAALGIVLGRSTANVREAEALDSVAGYLVVADFSVPHDSFYRPAIRFRARDASCVLGAAVTPSGAVGDPDALALRVSVDGRVVHEASSGGTIRPVARLIAEVSEFMTLAAGDVLLAGVAPGAPRVTAGARIAVEIDRVGRLETRVAVVAGHPA